MSRLIDDLSNYLAPRKGLLPLVGCLLVVINFILRVLASGSWLAATDFFLHLGLVIAIFGFLIARVL